MGNTINKPKPSIDPTQILIELAIVLDHPRFRLNFRASLQIPQLLFKWEYGFNWVPSSHADDTEQENLQQNVQRESRSLAPKSRSVFSNVPLNQCAESSLPMLEVNSATKNPYFLSEEPLERVYLGSLRSGYSDLSRTSKSIGFRHILTGDAGVQRHNSARNICRILFGNMQSTEDWAFNLVNQNEELQSSSGSVTVLNAKQSVFPSSQENGISGVLECKSICRLLFDHVKGEGDVTFDLVKENVNIQSSPLTATLPNARRFVLDSFKENMISGVSECKDICIVKFYNTKGKENEAFDSVVNHAKLHASSLILTVPNAKKYVLHSFEENRISGDIECKNMDTLMLVNCVNNESKEMLASSYKENLTPTTSLGKNLKNSSIGFQRLSPNDLMLLNGRETPIYHMKDERVEAFTSSYKESAIQNYLTVLNGEEMPNDAQSSLVNQSGSCCVSITVYDRILGEVVKKRAKIIPFQRLLNNTPSTDNNSLGGAHTSSDNQLECSSISITVYDRSLRRLIRKRVKMIPFQCLLENSPSGNNNSLDDGHNLSTDQSEYSPVRVHNSSGYQLESSSISITVYDRSLRRRIRKRVKKIPFRCLLEHSTSENNNSWDDEHNFSADQSEHSPVKVHNSSGYQLESSSISITVYDRSLKRLIRKRVKMIPFECLLENSQSGNNNALDDEHNLSNDRSEHSPITINTSSGKQLESSSVSITMYDRNLSRLIRKRVKRISFQCLLEKSPLGNNNSFNVENNLSANQPEHSPVWGQSTSEISVNMKTDKHAALSPSNDYLTPEVSRDEEPKKHLSNRQERIEREKINLGSERVQIQSSVNIFSRKNHPSYHAWQSSNKFGDNSFGQSISENSVNTNKEEQAAFPSSNDNLTPNATGVEMMPYKSFMETTFSRNSSSFYHACEASNNLAANSFSQHKDQLPTKAGEENRWNIIVDASCLLDKNSKRSLELLEGIKGTHLIIPKIVIRELDCMKRHEGWFSRTGKASSVLKWITKCMLRSSQWIQVQSSLEMMPTEPISAASSLPQFWTGPSYSKSLSLLTEIVSPTIEDHILDCALSFKKLKNDAKFVLLTNNVTLKIKAMAEGLVCEKPTEFCQSLLDPYSKRFLWPNSRPKGYTLSRSDEQLIMTANYNHRFPVPTKVAKTAEGAKGLQLILPLSFLYEKTNSVM